MTDPGTITEFPTVQEEGEADFDNSTVALKVRTGKEEVAGDGRLEGDAKPKNKKAHKYHHASFTRQKKDGPMAIRRHHSTSNLADLLKGADKGAERKTMFRPIEDDYVLGKTIGTGGYAVVKEAVHKETGVTYAVKIMKIAGSKSQAGSSEGDSDEDSEESEEEEEYDNDNSTEATTMTEDDLSIQEIMDSEIQLVQKLDHPNIIKLKEYLIFAGNCYIVMDMLKGPPLLDALLEMGRYTEEDAKEIFRQLLDAIAYMHLNGVVHRDLKLENLVLAEPGNIGRVVIVDFGFAKAARKREKMEEIVGTLWYSAPELLCGIPYTPAVDMWALGVGLYMLLCGQFPFDNDDEEELEREIIKTKIDLTTSDWEAVSDEAKDLVHGLLKQSPMQRLTATEATQHGWLNDVPTHDAATLHHVCHRLSELVAATSLPTKSFAAGEIMRADDEADDGSCFMIVSGECEVLVKKTADPTSLDEDAGARDRASSAEYINLGIRRQGNFVGEVGVRLADRHLLGLTGSPTSSPRAGAGSPRKPSSLQTPRERGSEDSDDAGGQRLMSGVLDTAQQWIGKKRVTIVRAVTAVTVKVLHPEHMQWAVEHDYRLGPELRRAMHKRRIQLRKDEGAERERAGSLDDDDERPTPPDAARHRSNSWNVPEEPPLPSGTPKAVAEDPRALFKALSVRIVKEYFDHSDVGEVAAQLGALEVKAGIKQQMYLLIKRAVTVALDYNARECELVAILLSAICPGMIGSEGIIKGYVELLEATEDLALDIPEAPDMITLFMARAVVDEMLPPNCFREITRQLEEGLGLGMGMGTQIALAAESLTKAPHATERILKAWGGGTAGTVVYVRERMAHTLMEFLTTKDSAEVQHCLHNLKVPYFHHEFVRKALDLAIEQSQHSAALLRLLKELLDSGVVNHNQMQQGFDRMREYVDDLELDVPGAGLKFEQLSAAAREQRVLIYAKEAQEVIVDRT